MRPTVVPSIWILLALFAFAPVLAGTEALASPSTTIAVNPVVPLHKMKKEEIYAVRRARIDLYKHLAIYPDNYVPDPQIYRSIDEQADWIQDTQFFVANPYLLVLTSAGTTVNALLPFCGVQEATCSGRQLEVVYRGRSAEQWFYYIYDYYPGSSGIVRLWFVNAYDAGYRFAHVDTQRSQNVVTVSGSPAAVAVGIYEGHEFYHRGSKGKNNISIDDMMAKIRLNRRNEPTLIYIKLWKNRPSGIHAPEDLAYVIRIVPD